MYRIHNIFHRIYRKSALLQRIHIGLYNYRQSKKTKKAINTIREYGYEALASFHQCMTENGYSYSLAFGTLLGAVREHDFIPHDNDIDLAMWIDDYRPEMLNCLAEYGFKLKHTFSIEGDMIGKEDTFDYKGVQLDVFYFYKDKEGITYCCDFVHFKDCSSWNDSIKKHGGLLPRKLFLPYSTDFQTIDFNGIKTSIPSNYHEILSFRYGVDYMIPKPGWRPNTQYIIEQPELLGVYKEY